MKLLAMSTLFGIVLGISFTWDYPFPKNLILGLILGLISAIVFGALRRARQ